MAFTGRDNDLKQLQECFTERRTQLAFVYGRRRVGKIETLIQLAKDKEILFSVVQNVTKDEQLASFPRLMLEASAPGKDYLSQYPSWERTLTELVRLPEPSDGGRRPVIFDELPYLVKSDLLLPSVLQNLWDHTLRHVNLMIVTRGSVMSFTEKELLEEKSPLYGRATGILKMLSMPYWDAAQFFPNYSGKDKALVYAILGGIPCYLEEFDPDETIDANVRRHILRCVALLHSEVESLLHEELRETVKHNSVIRAIAPGATSLNKIATYTMMANTTVSSYLAGLMELRIVGREFPVMAKPKERAKGPCGLYQLSDNFFRFWYSFAFSYRSELGRGDVEGVYECHIEPVSYDFVGKSSEGLCREWVWRESAAGRSPSRARVADRWWDRQDEIDVMAVGNASDAAIVGECKSRNTPVDRSVLNLSQDRAA